MAIFFSLSGSGIADALPFLNGGEEGDPDMFFWLDELGPASLVRRNDRGGSGS